MKPPCITNNVLSPDHEYFCNESIAIRYDSLKDKSIISRLKRTKSVFERTNYRTDIALNMIEKLSKQCNSISKSVGDGCFVTSFSVGRGHLEERHTRINRKIDAWLHSIANVCSYETFIVRNKMMKSPVKYLNDRNQVIAICSPVG